MDVLALILGVFGIVAYVRIHALEKQLKKLETLNADFDSEKDLWFWKRKDQ